MSIQVGQACSVRRALAQPDFDRFAALSGDTNPIHVDPEFAARTKFGQTVAHGMFLYGVICGVLGTRLPGPGTRQIEQELMFPSATPAGQEIEIRLEVTSIYPEHGVADLSTQVMRADGGTGLQGRTRVQLPNRSAQFGPGSMPPDSPALGPQSFRGMTVGQRALVERTFTPQSLVEYADLTGDTNPLFCDATHARNIGLNGPLVPGPLLGGLFSHLLGTVLPGRGTNYLKQRLFFVAPALVGERLVASVEIIRFRPEKELVNLGTVCAGPAGSIICHGEALVLVSDVDH